MQSNSKGVVMQQLSYTLPLSIIAKGISCVTLHGNTRLPLGFYYTSLGELNAKCLHLPINVCMTWNLKMQLKQCCMYTFTQMRC